MSGSSERTIPPPRLVPRTQPAGQTATDDMSPLAIPSTDLEAPIETVDATADSANEPELVAPVREGKAQRQPNTAPIVPAGSVTWPVAGHW